MSLSKDLKKEFSFSKEEFIEKIIGAFLGDLLKDKADVFSQLIDDKDSDIQKLRKAGVESLTDALDPTGKAGGIRSEKFNGLYKR